MNGWTERSRLENLMWVAVIPIFAVAFYVTLVSCFVQLDLDFYTAFLRARNNLVTTYTPPKATLDDDPIAFDRPKSTLLLLCLRHNPFH